MTGSREKRTSEAVVSADRGAGGGHSEAISECNKLSRSSRGNTLDLVVLAAESGNGRRSGLLSNLHLGARDATDGYVMRGADPLEAVRVLNDPSVRRNTLPRGRAG